MPGGGADELSAAVAITRRAFERFRADDLDGLLELVHPEAEFRPVFVGGGSYSGRDAIREAFGEVIARRWGVREVEIEEISGRVLVAARLQVMSTIGTAEDYPVALVLDFAGGRISRIESFVHRRQAREAIRART